jgi:hypothetical protein
VKYLDVKVYQGGWRGWTGVGISVDGYTYTTLQKIHFRYPTCERYSAIPYGRQNPTVGTLFSYTLWYGKSSCGSMHEKAPVEC